MKNFTLPPSGCVMASPPASINLSLVTSICRTSHHIDHLTKGVVHCLLFYLAPGQATWEFVNEADRDACFSLLSEDLWKQN